jgi:hypothetical protein
MSTEKLAGVEKAKTAIENFKNWLINNCQPAMPKSDVLAKYQILSGHGYRKLEEWLRSLTNVGVVKTFENGGNTFVVCSSAEAPEQKKQKTQSVEELEMDMNSQTPFTDSVKRKTLLKDLNEARNELGLPPLPIRKDS